MNFSTTFQKLLKGVVRVILFAVATVLVAALLSGCGKPTDTSVLDGHGKRFVCIESSFLGEVYVDTETGVEWLCVNSRIQPIIDSYGNPYVYPGFDAREDALPGQKIG